MLATAGLAAVSAASGAQAQYHERDRNVSVRERGQPGYDPIGIRLGTFRGYGTLPVGVTFTDNVFATPSGEEDVILNVRPQLELRSQWSRHMLNLGADVDTLVYNDFTSEDRTNFTLSGLGRVDIQRGFFGSFNIRDAWLQEPRTDASAPSNTLEPVEYEHLQVGGDLSKEFNRLRVSGGVSHAALDYENTLAADGVTPVFQNDRDHESTTWTGRGDVALTPATAVFASVGVSTRDYKIQPVDSPAVLFSRDSKGQTYSLGANFDLTNLIRGEVSLGYLTEDFVDPLFSDIDGLAAQARVEWFPTPLATFEFSAQRAVTETGIAGAAGALTTTLGARVDYELRRNVIVTGQLTHRDDEYEGVARDDTGLQTALDVLYLVNEHVGASVTFQRTERESNVAFAEFEQNSLGLNLVLRY